MLETISVFALGLIFGSFINVLGLRWNSGLGFSGRSFCATCGKRLKWWELIPLLSFILLKARCSKCRTKISWLYPLVEVWTGVLFVSIYLAIDPSGSLSFFYYLIITTVFCIYTAIGIYDFRHKIIPDNLVYLSIILAFSSRFLIDSNYLDWLSGPIAFTFLGLIWLLTKGKALGFGDAKLGLSIGFLLGGSMGLSALALAFWIGAVMGLLYILFMRIYPLFGSGKKITMKSEIPFAPFMILGAWLALVFQVNIFNVPPF
ncbi:MAG: prepilin peptidase [Parcubacteria group bacterium]